MMAEITRLLSACCISKYDPHEKNRLRRRSVDGGSLTVKRYLEPTVKHSMTTGMEVNIGVDLDLLVNLVRVEESLWNPNHKQFQNEEHNRRLWKTVAMLLGVTDDVARQEWRILHNNFCNELYRRLKNGSEDHTGESISNYKYNRMLFLKDQLLLWKGISCLISDHNCEHVFQFSEENSSNLQHSCYRSNRKIHGRGKLNNYSKELETIRPILHNLMIRLTHLQFMQKLDLISEILKNISNELDELIRNTKMPKQ